MEVEKGGLLKLAETHPEHCVHIMSTNIPARSKACVLAPRVTNYSVEKYGHITYLRVLASWRNGV